MHVAVVPENVWSAWTFDPPVVAGIVVGGLLYARGVQRLWARAGTGRGIAPWRAWSFAGGLLATMVALISPLAAWGGALFSAHMLQHVVLMLVAAPLLVLGAPLRVMLWAFDGPDRRSLGALSKVGWLRRTWHGLTNPVTAWMLHAGALWVWHLPSLFSLTLRSESAHIAQHVSFFGTALLFWWVLGEHGHSRRMHAGAGILYVFTTALHSAALGALLTFADMPLYPAYGSGAAAWGLTPLEDQQFAGLIMWVPGGMVYLAAALALFAAWMRASEARATLRERLAVSD